MYLLIELFQYDDNLLCTEAKVSSDGELQLAVSYKIAILCENAALE